MKFNHKQIIISTAFGCLIIWFFRLDLGDDRNERQARSLESIILPTIQQNVKWTSDDLEKRLTVFVPRKQTVEIVKAQNVVKAVQTKPAAKAVDKTLKPMFSLLDEEHQVGLLAIIQQNEEKFAVLQKINFVSRQSDNIKVKNNTVFSGFTLSIHSQTEIHLSNSNKEIVLNLFKPRNS